MKILVIGVPRSGTTSLIKAVSEKYVSEPFYNRIDNADNAIGIIKEHIRLGNNIKFTVEQYPKDCTSDIKRARFWKRLVALFDKTLLKLPSPLLVGNLVYTFIEGRRALPCPHRCILDPFGTFWDISSGKYVKITSGQSETLTGGN